MSLSAHDHGNCELCDQLEAELAEKDCQITALNLKCAQLEKSLTQLMPDYEGIHRIAAARIADLESSLKAAQELLAESNAVCACLCPPDEHEDYGEDGESCSNDNHQCIRTSVAVRDMLKAAQEKLQRMEAALTLATDALTLAAPALRGSFRLPRPWLKTAKPTAFEDWDNACAAIDQACMAVEHALAAIAEATK